MSDSTTGEFRISDDLEIFVNYEGAAICPLFYLSLKYKGIDILPYSYFVDYYYADSHDIANYTRRYDVDSASWAYAFDFVMNISEQVRIEGNRFVEEMLRDEVDKLMKGLSTMIANPMRYLERMVSDRRRGESDGVHYYSVRHMTVDEEMKYRAYPHEMMFLLMAEKISGALDFVSGLKRLEQIDPTISGVSDEILLFSRKLYPALEKKITSMKADVALLQDQENALGVEINNLKTQMDDSKSNAIADCADRPEGLQRALAKQTNICWDRCHIVAFIAKLEESMAIIRSHTFVPDAIAG